MSYPIPAESCELTYEIKKSRFIARAAYAPDRDAAMALLQQAKADYPDARHHCWAYLLGDPGNAASAAMSDDGEPSGTAGKPILNVLQHKGVGDIMLVVIRYFGGIKLGAGGLVRAYSAASQQAMEALAVETRVAMCPCRLECDFSQEQAARHWLGQNDGVVESVDYGSAVSLNISVPQASLPELQQFVRDRGLTLVADNVTLVANK